VWRGLSEVGPVLSALGAPALTQAVPDLTAKPTSTAVGAHHGQVSDAEIVAFLTKQHRSRKGNDESVRAQADCESLCRSTLDSLPDGVSCPHVQRVRERA